jgi:murein DD-endopeptidase MepM/ murein hydrolase activator NlpD
MQIRPVEKSRRVRSAAVGLAMAAIALIAGAREARPAEKSRQVGGGEFPGPGDRISDAFYQRVSAEVDANAARLAQSGHLPAADPLGAPLFVWPIATSGIGYFSPFGISNYVDHDADAGWLDYSCGDRSYDGHNGVDIFTWPFGWLAVDQSHVAVLAAAAGSIVAKDDGNFDRRCSCDTDDPNYVILQHADGSRAWYLHFKSGSTTTKPIGGAVAAGEQIGIVGSSGCSTGPHLHFEVHDAGAGGGPVLDPFDGACNLLNPGSLWQAQRPYREPTINHLATGMAAPDFPTCPVTETPNEKRRFEDGDTIYFLTYLHDETPAHSKHLEVRRPDGSIYDAWDHATPVAYDASYWWWFWPSFDAGGIAGRWTFRVTLDGVTRVRAFWIDALFADDFEDANAGAWSSSVP